MTQDEIIRMGMEAGMRFQPRLDSPRLLTFTNETLERFAALVAAHEREACAKVCEANAPWGNISDDWAAKCLTKAAEAIRARNEK